jgi:hypothetical protein
MRRKLFTGGGRLTACAAAAAVVAGMTFTVASAGQAPVRAANHDRYWPTWRGPAGIGTSSTANPPTEWSESKNLRW